MPCAWGHSVNADVGCDFVCVDLLRLGLVCMHNHEFAVLRRSASLPMQTQLDVSTAQHL